jgi:hypothetical protein
MSSPQPPAPGNEAADYRFALVTVHVNVPIYLVAAVTRVRTAVVAAQAMAGELLTTSVPGGEFPLSPSSRKNASPDDPNDPFGFKVGNAYTILWGPPGTRNTCGTDTGRLGPNASFRGYCCTGGSSVVDVRDVLAGKGTVPVSVGDPFGPLVVPGQKNSISVQDWIHADTDEFSPNYASYRSNTINPGNKKRIIVVAVNNNEQTVADFAAFFLYPAVEYTGNTWCAKYLGSMVQGVPGMPPGSGSGIYQLRLTR